MGYDGKGQSVVADAGRRRAGLSNWRSTALYEELHPVDCEVSIIGARSRRGQVAVYPLTATSIPGDFCAHASPFGPPRWQRLAAGYLERVLAHFRYTGILTIEFFVRAAS